MHAYCKGISCPEKKVCLLHLEFLELSEESLSNFKSIITESIRTGVYCEYFLKGKNYVKDKER